MSDKYAALQAARELTIQALQTMVEVVNNAFNGIQNALQSDPVVLPSDDCYMDLQDACAFTGIPEDTMHKLTAKNRITFTRPNGGKLYFKKSDLVAYMEKGRIPSNDELVGRR